VTGDPSPVTGEKEHESTAAWMEGGYRAE